VNTKWQGLRGALLLGIFVLLVPATASAVLSTSASIGANTFTTPTLPAPSGLAASASCNGTLSAKAALSWTAVTPTPLSLVDGYDVWRAVGGAGGAFSFVTHVNGRTTTAYTNTGLLVATQYSYKIVSTRNNWTSGYSNTVTVTTPTLCL
jgi:hypothetical protein